MSLIAVGDIHGNIRALDDLLNTISTELSPEDTLVFLGDYIDRGPNVRECVDRIIDLKATARFSVVTLLGNHEDWMLKTYNDHSADAWIRYMEAFDTIASYSEKAAHALSKEVRRTGVRAILRKPKLSYDLFFSALPAKHVQFFGNLQRYHRADGVLCVHGGIDTRVQQLESQNPEVFLWGCNDFPDSYRGEDSIVYGHHRNAVLDAAGWPHPNIKDNRTYGIDTISHGVLTAIRFPGGHVFQSRRFNTQSLSAFSRF